MKYEIIIFWSDLDSCFIAEVPQLEGCIAHGITEEIALLNIKEAMSFYLEVLKESGKPIPVPKGEKLMYA